MELVGGSCEEEEEEVVGGLGGASLEEGCWSVVRHPAKVDTLAAIEWWRGTYICTIFIPFLQL